MRFLRVPINALVLLAPLVPLGIGGYKTVRGVFEYLNTGQRLAGTLSAEATKALGRNVRIGDVKITGNLLGFTAHNEVELRDVSIAETASPNSPTLARVGRVLVGYNLQQVAGSGNDAAPIVDGVSVEDAELRLVRDAGGRWNFTPLLQELLTSKGTSNRSLTTKITLRNARVNYADFTFPHPPGVPARPFFAAIRNVGGVAIIRPDKGVSFDLTGTAPTDIAGNFHLVGIESPNPLVISAKLTAVSAHLPVIAARILPPGQARILQGTANVDLTAVYTPAKGANLLPFNREALVASGAIQMANVSAVFPRLDGPLSNLNGAVSFDMTAAQVDLRGDYQGVSSSVRGSLFNLPLAQIVKLGGAFPLRDFRPTVALSGDLRNIDFARALKIRPIAAQISRLPAAARNQLRTLRGTLTDFPFTLTGTLDNPTLVLTAALPAVQTQMARAEKVHLTAALANHALSLDFHALLGGGELGVRASADVTGHRIGPYRIVARGRDLQLRAVQGFLPGKQTLSGTAQLDAAASGSGNLTPKIQTQAQVANMALDGQTIRSVYLDAGTSRNKIVVHNARIEDEKGYAVVNGTIDFYTRALDLSAEADELDVDELTKIALKLRPALAKKLAASKTPFHLEGIAYLRGADGGPARITGTLDDPKAQAHVTAFDVQFNNIAVDQAEATLDVTKDTLIVARGSVVRAPGTVTISGLISGLRDPQPDVNITARVDSMDLNYLLETAGISTDALDLTGTLSTASPVLISGSLTDPRIRQPFTVSVDDLTVKGLPVANVTASADYGPEGIHLIDASAAVAGGIVSAHGVIQTDGKLDLIAKATDLHISDAIGVLPAELESFRGTLNAAAAVTGTAKNPEVSATLDAQKLAYSAASAGRLQGKATYANSKIVLGPASLTDFAGAGAQIDIPRLTYDLRTKTANGTVEWSGMTFGGFRDLLQNYADADPDANPEALRNAAKTLADLTATIQANTAGKVLVAGTLSDPKLTIDWDDIPITLDGYPITLLKGEAHAGKTQASIPEMRLTAADGEVDINAPKIVYNGDLQVDINALGINLGVMQKWLKPVNAPANSLPQTGILATARRLLASQGNDAQIGGTATFAAAIRGRTKAPDITQATLNISDLKLTRLPTAEELQEIQLSLKTPKGKASPQQNRVTVYDLSRLDINSANVTGGVLTVSDAGASLGNTQVHGSAKITDFAWQPPFFSPEAVYHAEAKLKLRDEKEQNLQEIAKLFPSILDPKSTGQITASAMLDRNPGEEWSVVGNVGLNAPRLQIARFRSGLRDVKSAFTFKGDSLSVDYFSAQTQIYNINNSPDNPKDAGSPITLTGSLPLSVPSGATTDPKVGLHFTVDRAVFAERPLPGSKSGAVRGALSANITIARALLTPRISGNVTLTEARLAIPSDFGGLPGGATTLPIDPRFRDLSLTIGKNVHVSNALINTVVTGNVSVGGSLSAPTLEGTMNLNGGKLALATTRLTILTPSTIRINYPVPDGGQQGLGLYVNLRAEGNLPRASTNGRTVSERVAFRVTGPLTGSVIDPNTGQSRLSITSNSPNFDQETLLQSLTLGSNPGQFGSNPGQAVQGLLTSAITGSFLPGVFDSTAQKLGFEELSVGYDALQELNLNVTRHLFGPFSASYSRALSGVVERYTFRLSAQIRGQFQASYETNEINEQKILLEGAWRF